MAAPARDGIARRPRRPAAARRLQRYRAEARLLQRVVGGLADLGQHRGCRRTRLGDALLQALRGGPGPPAGHVAAQHRAPGRQVNELTEHLVAGLHATDGQSAGWHGDRHSPADRRQTATVASVHRVSEPGQRVPPLLPASLREARWHQGFLAPTPPLAPATWFREDVTTEDSLDKVWLLRADAPVFEPNLDATLDISFDDDVFHAELDADQSHEPRAMPLELPVLELPMFKLSSTVAYLDVPEDYQVGGDDIVQVSAVHSQLTSPHSSPYQPALAPGHRVVARAAAPGFFAFEGLQGRVEVVERSDLPCATVDFGHNGRHRIPVTCLHTLPDNAAKVSKVPVHRAEGAPVGDAAVPAHILLNVQAPLGNPVQFKISKTTPLRKLMEAYCSRFGLQASKVRFMVNGERISPGDSAGTLGIEDMALIYVAPV